jgi:hypothetical protein
VPVGVLVLHTKMLRFVKRIEAQRQAGLLQLQAPRHPAHVSSSSGVSSPTLILRGGTTGTRQATLPQRHTALINTSHCSALRLACVLADVQVLHTKMLRFVNRVAGAIKRAAPGTKVTTGAHSMLYNSDVPIPNLKKGRSDYNSAPFNYWKDSMLVSFTTLEWHGVSPTCLAQNAFNATVPDLHYAVTGLKPNLAACGCTCLHPMQVALVNLAADAADASFAGGCF